MDGRRVERHLVRPRAQQDLGVVHRPHPSPTVKGRYTASATRRTMSITIGRASEEAVMSRKTSSSAPSAS